MLGTRLSSVLGTNKQHLSRLDYLGLKTVQDLLVYFPRTYEDQRQMKKITEIVIGEINTIKGVISNISNKYSMMRKLMTSALVSDASGSIEVLWFNQPHIVRLLKPGTEIIFSGKINYNYGRLMLQNPTYEIIKLEQIHTARLVPIYHETSGVTSKWLREKIYKVMPYTEYFEEYLPTEIIDRQNLISYAKAVNGVHFPTTPQHLNMARERLAFDELFIIQLIALQKKWLWYKDAKSEKIKIKIEQELLDRFISELPFSLTNAQKRSIDEAVNDLNKDFPMLRLLQGDVGSGKTIVAAAIALGVMKAGYQVVLMAPTEILANQHSQTMSKFLVNKGITIGLLTGSMTNKEKEEMVSRLKSGEMQFIIGTHALIQEKVGFKNLGLAIVDEQHRFGVKQRDRLKTFDNPHLLNLSATPIPRTLAMVIYGDQDLSIIDEMPPGRQKIITRIVPEEKRQAAYDWIKEKVNEGRQVFIICPLIDESNVLEVKSVLAEYERLANLIFPNLNVAFIHGRLKQEEKDEIMNNFTENKINILVSTSLIEVGIDIPNATVMIIEGAERFGLSQLHQFRGRVGRGTHQSYCFLFPTLDNEEIRKRLSAMVKYDSGFQLAEIDLELRGPGEIYGVKQSGIPDLKMASISDSKLIARARAEASSLIKLDPELNMFPKLKEKIDLIKKEKSSD